MPAQSIKILYCIKMVPLDYKKKEHPDGCSFNYG